MAAPFFAGMASFANNFTKSYNNERDRAALEEERKSERQWREKQRSWMEQDRNEKQGDAQAMRDAMADRTTMQGTAVTDGTGNASLYKDPMQAAAQADEARIEAEMRGQSPDTVMTAPATGVTGPMSRGHQITSGPVDMASVNSREAKVGRAADALMSRGKVQDALSMENSILDSKAKQLGFKREELKFADEMTRRLMGEELASGETWAHGAANHLTKSQYKGLKDVKGEPVFSEDGKTVTLFAVMPDGTRHNTGTYPAGEEGAQLFMEKFGKLPIETRMALMAERAKTDYQKGRDAKKDETDAARLALDDRRTTVAERNAATSERRMETILSRGQGGGAGGGVGSAPGPGWKERREVLGDFGNLLPDPKGVVNPEQAAAIQAKNTTDLAKADAMFSTNAQFGVVLSGPQLKAAMDLAGDPKNVRTVRDNVTGAIYEAVTVNGTPVVVSAAMQQQPAPAPAPASASASAPDPAVVGTKAPPPAPPSRPTAPTTAAPAVSMQTLAGSKPAPVAAPQVKSPQTLGDDFASPMAKQALIARVSEAAAGGAPLTRVEALRAKQLGIL